MNAIDTLVRRIGRSHEDEVLCAVVRLTDEQVQQLSEDTRVTSMAVLRRRIEALPVRRRPSSSPDARWFERKVCRLELYTEEDTGERLVSAWVLSCGHTIPTHKRVHAYTRTKTMPCPVCGSGTRTPFERRREAEALEEAFTAAYGTDGARQAFSALVRCATLCVTLSPLDRRMGEVRQEMAQTLSALGLTPAETRTEAYA